MYNERRMKVLFGLFSAAALCLFPGCYRPVEYTLAEIEAMQTDGSDYIEARTSYKPWRGEDPVDGIPGGVLYESITNDPKTFNLLVAERDAETLGVVSHMYDPLLDYDYVRHEFIPRCASAEIIPDEEAGTLSVVYTLREDLYWSFFGKEEKIPVTSDDVIFWYNEIEGDPAFHSSAYNSRFVEMEDGTTAEITVEKIDDKRFAFHLPRMDANALLSTNRIFGPAFIFREAKERGGTRAVLDLFSVASDPRQIPSMGMWFLVEYTPGQRLVYRRNPDYWNKDGNGFPAPYPEEKTVQIVPDQNTQFLLFKQGRQDFYSLRPEDVDEMLSQDNPDYTVFRADGSLGATFWTFNQNPINQEKPFYRWFTQKEFRQAMSCLLNRDRIISQTFRGLADPKYDFFPEPNLFYNPDITLQYRFDHEAAAALLAECGMQKDAAGILRDAEGNAVEFDLTITADSSVATDIASIIADECAKAGIRIRIRALDFQKMIEQLTSTYDWQSVIVGLGANYWPSQGSNVWPSDGNLHVWYPLQKTPATEWEARIDFLYNEGCFTPDEEKAKAIWDEYQTILLEQCPLIYLVRPQSFLAVHNRWDFSNVYFDHVGGLRSEHIFLQEAAFASF